MEVSDVISEKDLLEGLNTDFIGSSLFVFDELESTNVKASELAREGAAEGTVVIADSQSGGRGRRGRQWSSPEGCNIYTSIILRPRIEQSRAAQLTLVASVALCEAILSATGEGVAAQIKWPNDILIGKKKCAGILAELFPSGRAIDYVVLGMGVNVNMDASKVPEDISDVATSLYMETGKFYSRIPLMQTLYSHIENWYKLYADKGFGPVRKRWNELSGFVDRPVRVASGDVYKEGISLGIDDYGALLLRGADGEVEKILAGDLAPG